MIVHQCPLARNKVEHRNLASRAPGWRRFWHGPFLTQNRRVPAADDLIELWDYTADDISRGRMPSQKMTTPTRPILICTIASRDLIVSFQGLSRRSSSTRRRPRLANVDWLPDQGSNLGPADNSLSQKYAKSCKALAISGRLLRSPFVRYLRVQELKFRATAKRVCCLTASDRE